MGSQPYEHVSDCKKGTIVTQHLRHKELNHSEAFFDCFRLDYKVTITKYAIPTFDSPQEIA